MSDFSNLPVIDPRCGGFVCKCDNIWELRNVGMVRFFSIAFAKVS